MKKYCIYIFLLISYPVYSQNAEWIVFKSSPPPIGSTSYCGFIFSSPAVIPGNFIVCIIQDEIGNIWVGTDNNGIAKYDGTNWRIYNTSNSGLPDNTIYAIALDKNGNKWIGTVNGLVKFDGTNWILYNTSNSGLPSNVIYSIVIDQSDIKWIGTATGLVKFDEEKWKVYKTSNSKLPSNRISALSVDHKGNKWIGTFDGLAKFDGINWKVFRKSNSGLPYNDIYSIGFEKKGETSIQTWGGGLAKYNGKKWTVFKTSNSGLPDNFISSIVKDGNGNEWIGTLSGLVKYDGKNWKVFNASNSSLPDKMVYSLLLDNFGNLWIGTQNGLAVFKEDGIVTSFAEVSSFYSENENNRITLFWKSENEANNSGFDIEKKTSYSDWRKIGSVKRKGNNDLINNYSFIDNHFKSEKISYRIKQIDLEGRYRYSNIIDLIIGIPKTFLLGKNDCGTFNSRIKINFGLPVDAFTKLTVHGPFGNEIKTLVNSKLIAGYHEIEYDTSDLPGGTYFCRIQINELTATKELALIK